MIKVEIKRNKENGIGAFTCCGHALYSKKADEFDIVCAAVSGIIFSALGYMQEYFGMEDFKEKSGYISWERPENLDNDIDNKISIALDVMVTGLKQVELQYPKNIRIVDEEV